MSRLLRLLAAALLLPLAAWGLCLSAFVSTALTLALAVALVARRYILAVPLAGMVLLSGLVEVPVRVTQLGAVSRAGALDVREQLAVAGVNALLAGASTALGFSDFGWETFVMLSPVSFDGRCPAERMRRYRQSGSAPLRVWSSDMPMRSPRLREIVRSWAQALPEDAPEGQTRRLGPSGPLTWKASAYFSAEEANRVPVALNAPTATLEGVAVRQDGRWRLELVAHLFVAYPERATLGVGPISLEEGMFHDASLVIHPYCGEYRFERDADDPSLLDPRPVRGPFERVSTALLRAAGAGYR